MRAAHSAVARLYKPHSGKPQPRESAARRAARSHRQAPRVLCTGPKSATIDTNACIDREAPGLEHAQQPSTSYRASDEVQHFFDWPKYGARIHYRKSGTSGPAVLLVHGFGVGSYHFEAQLDYLAQRGYRVFAVDLLGQGQSWPTGLTANTGLVYSVETWVEQLQTFVQEVVKEPVYVGGNSLGGFLAVALAAAHPSTVRGVALLNATPFWAFAPHPSRSNALLSALLPWDGKLPAPPSIRTLIDRFWWRQFCSETNIRMLLRLVYANAGAAGDDALVAAIMRSTASPHALDAFASIVFAPKSAQTFDEMLASIRAPLALIYGRDDPWVVPLWGQRIKRLQPHAPYFEVAPAGHCVHHEAAPATNDALARWLDAAESGLTGPELEAAVRADAEKALGGATAEGWEVEGVTVRLVDGSPRNVFEYLDAALWQVRNALMPA